MWLSSAKRIFFLLFCSLKYLFSVLIFSHIVIAWHHSAWELRGVQLSCKVIKCDHVIQIYGETQHANRALEKTLGHSHTVVVNKIVKICLTTDWLLIFIILFFFLHKIQVVTGIIIKILYYALSIIPSAIGLACIEHDSIVIGRNGLFFALTGSLSIFSNVSKPSIILPNTV